MQNTNLQNKYNVVEKQIQTIVLFRFDGHEIEMIYKENIYSRALKNNLYVTTYEEFENLLKENLLTQKEIEDIFYEEKEIEKEITIPIEEVLELGLVKNNSKFETILSEIYD